MRIAVVVPTYNERENVQLLTEAILKQEKKMNNHDLHVVIADSNSPDGTGEVVTKLSKSNPKIHLVSDERRGIGVGLLTGMEYAFSKLKADAAINMDADFSHDPDDLPRLVEKFDEGHDVVIGSRYMPGGGTKNWGFIRKWGSFFVNLYIRIMLGLKPSEITTNFRLFSKKVWSSLDKESVPWTEKSFLTTPSLLYFVLKAVPEYAEIPILFVDRTRGYSKAMLFTYARAIFLFSLKERRGTIMTFFKFLGIGLTGVVVNLGMLYFLVERMSWQKELASPVAVETSILSNFILNNFYTFAGRDVKSGMLGRLAKYNIISLGGLTINYLVFLFLTSLGLHYLLAQLVGIAFATPLSFLASMKWAWRRKE